MHYWGDELHISIHTPAKGVTRCLDVEFLLRQFQSTLPRREWQCQESKRYGKYAISIHTPAKGVTHSPSRVFRDQVDFNPHSREGSDNISLHIRISHRTFQSTLPRREWHIRVYVSELGELFQSTLPRREWLIGYIAMAENEYISIHTPAKGVTKVRRNRNPCYAISIHTPAKGVTYLNIVNTDKTEFQSTLPRREWLRTVSYVHVSAYFNPHSREGSDSNFT